MADVELLPLPSEVRLAIRAYARACVEANLAPLQAENERLRAEVERWKSLHATAYDAFRTGVATERRLEARAERLAEALRFMLDRYRGQVDNTGDYGEAIIRGQAALAQEDRNG